jgi:hypothetical protein
MRSSTSGNNASRASSKDTVVPWIESHQTVGHHPKTIRLAELLKVNLPTAVGHLHYFWWWALDFAPTGEIRTTPGVLARACEWRGNAEKFRDALLAAGFVEWCNEALVIHDWWDYAGRYVDKRAANAQRMRDARAAHVARTSGARAGATVPDHTGPNRTGPVACLPSPVLTPGPEPSARARETASPQASQFEILSTNGELPPEVAARLAQPPIAERHA